MAAAGSKKMPGGIGLTVSPEVIQSLDGMTTSLRQVVGDENEVRLLQSVLLYKAADNAIVENRDNVTEIDLKNIFRFCIPFFKHCYNTSILNNPYVTASVLSAGDGGLLQSIGIDRNEQLARANTEDVVNAIIAKVTQMGRNVEINEEEKNIVRKRVSIWKIQAQLLSNRRGAPSAQRTNAGIPPGLSPEEAEVLSYLSSLNATGKLQTGA